MTFNFHLTNAAGNNNREARIREQTRMACIARGLSIMGHEVRIVGASEEFRGSERYTHFKDLFAEHKTGALEVHPAETMRNREHRVDVGIKCSVGIQNDANYLSRCQVLVAHEYDENFDDHPHLLPVPFMVHDSVMAGFITDGMFDAFIRNEVRSIRERYCREKNGLLGLRCCGWTKRKEFCANAPEWADIGFYDTPQMKALEHARWISGFRGGLCLRGDTPKTNSPSLLALLGVAIVMQPIARRDTPRMDYRNTIQFGSWEQVRLELENDSHLGDITAQATNDYINGWSPLGQARLIAERLS
jgi:hypothetical protein